MSLVLGKAPTQSRVDLAACQIQHCPINYVCFAVVPTESINIVWALPLCSQCEFTQGIFLTNIICTSRLDMLDHTNAYMYGHLHQRRLLGALQGELRE